LGGRGKKIGNLASSERGGGLKNAITAHRNDKFAGIKGSGSHDEKESGKKNMHFKRGTTTDKEIRKTKGRTNLLKHHATSMPGSA